MCVHVLVPAVLNLHNADARLGADGRAPSVSSCCRSSQDSGVASPPRRTSLDLAQPLLSASADPKTPNRGWLDPCHRALSPSSVRGRGRPRGRVERGITIRQVRGASRQERRALISLLLAAAASPARTFGLTAGAQQLHLRARSAPCLRLSTQVATAASGRIAPTWADNVEPTATNILRHDAHEAVLGPGYREERKRRFFDEVGL
jgi:hypothetical protein